MSLVGIFSFPGVYTIFLPGPKKTKPRDGPRAVVHSALKMACLPGGFFFLFSVIPIDAIKACFSLHKYCK